MSLHFLSTNFIHTKVDAVVVALAHQVFDEQAASINHRFHLLSLLR
jgi:hypothetical protein